MGIMTSPQRHAKSGIYYFRMAVPKKLVPIIGKTVFKQSLRTTSAAEAKQRILEPLANAQHQITLAEHKLAGHSSIELTVKDCVIIAERWYEHVKKEVEASGDFSSIVSYERDVDNHIHTFGLADTLSIDGRDLKTATVEQLNALVQDLDLCITSQLDREGLVISSDSNTFRQLAKEFHPYVHRMQLLCEARHVSNWAYEPIVTSLAKNEIATQPVALSDTPSVIKVNSIATVFKRFTESEKLMHKGSLSRVKTLDETSLQVQRFITINGDMDVGEVSRSHITNYRDTLFQLPKSKLKTIRCKSIAEQIKFAKDTGLPLLSPTTVKNSMRQLSVVFSHAVELSLISVNPMAGVKVKTASIKLEVKEAKGYKDTEIQNLFQHELFQDVTVSKPYGMACYWIPILCRYTGARITEIAQLNKSDVSQSDTGIHYLNIRRGKGQSIKTDASLRHIPIPQHIIELGFISYVESSSEVLFPEIPVDKYGRKASVFAKWWRGVMDNRGVDNTQPFHAFRHSFKTSMRTLEIADTVSDAITGHAPKTEGERYGTVTLETKQKSIDRLPRLDLVRL